MEERWWEEPVCIFCDYWWAFLLAIILIVLLFVPPAGPYLASSYLEWNEVPQSYMDEFGIAAPGNIIQAYGVVVRYENYLAAQAYLKENNVPQSYLDEFNIKTVETVEEAKVVVERYQNYLAAQAYLQDNNVPKSFLDDFGIKTPETVDEAKIIVERYENYHAALAYLAENGVPERYWEEMGITPENVEQAKFVVEQYLDDEALKAEIRELHDALLSYQSQIEQEELDMLAEIQSTIAADLTPWLDSLFIAYANELIQDAEKQASENGNEQDPLGIVVCYSISFIPGVGNVVDAWSELVEGKDRCTGKEASIESKTLTFVSLFADVIDWADTIKDMEKAMEASKAADRLGTLAKLDPQDIEAIRDASRLDFVLDAARVDAMSDVARYAGKDADLITSLFELRKLSRQVEKSGNLIDKVLLFQKINYLKTTGKWEDVIRYANKINGVNAEESLRMAGLLSESIEAKQWDNIVDAMKQAGGKYDNLATTAEAIKDLRSAEKFLATPGVLDAEQAVTARYLMQMIMKGSGVSDELRDLLKKTEQIGPVKDLIRANKWDENIEMYASFRLRPRTAAWKVWAFERITESQFLKEVVEDGVENVFEKVNDHFYTCITNNMSCWDIVENYDMPADQLHSYIQLRLTDYRALSALGYSTNVFFSTEPPTQVKDLLNSEGISWYTPSKLP